MTTLLLVKDFYRKAFGNLRKLEVVLLKSLAWISLIFLAIALIAFAYRVATGFFMV